MEVEAKFSIPDRVMFERLHQVRELVGYRLEPAGLKWMRDRYVDTDGRAILQAGYACRLRLVGTDLDLVDESGAARSAPGSYIATLKGLGGADASSGIHQRAEYEVPVDGADLNTWPDSPARDLALRLCEARSLVELLSLVQERHLRLVHRDSPAGSRLVAELSLDVVTPTLAGTHDDASRDGGEPQTYFELEIELLEEGSQTDLQALAESLRTTWGLQPEARSKFERGLELANIVITDERGERVVAGRLSPEERIALQTWLETGSRPKQRRARAILLHDEGHGTPFIAAQVGLSPRQVRRWLAAFRARRMGIFPRDAKVWEGPASQAVVVIGQVPAVEDVGLRDVGLRIITQEPALPALPLIGAELGAAALPELKSPGLLPDDPMSEAGRKTLWFHFLRLLKHEPGTRSGEDIEELHDMRVATRRMRAAFRVFGDFFDPKAIAPYIKGLQRVTRALGPVRDLDVFEEKAVRYLDTLPEEARPGLDPLIENWHDDRQKARSRMLAFLDSGRYRDFKLGFSRFLQTPLSGARSFGSDHATPFQTRHVAPRLIYTRYEAVRAYETVLDNAQVETLHALRIDCKYLRYTLEFLREVLGLEVEAVIEEVKAVQDHLGDLVDANVAIGLLSEFLSNWDARQAHLRLSQRRSVEGVVTYLASCHAQKHRLLISFPRAWDVLNRDEVRRWLALAVATL